VQEVKQQSAHGVSLANLEGLKIYKPKSRDGAVDRIMDGQTLVGKNFFAKEADMTAFLGMKMKTEFGAKPPAPLTRFHQDVSTGDEGTLDGPFGKTGKFKVSFPNAKFDVSKDVSTMFPHLFT